MKLFAASLLVQVALSIEVEVSDMGTILGHPRNSFDPAGRVVNLFLDNTHLQSFGIFVFFSLLILHFGLTPHRHICSFVCLI